MSPLLAERPQQLGTMSIFIDNSQSEFDIARYFYNQSFNHMIDPATLGETIRELIKVASESHEQDRVSEGEVPVSRRTFFSAIKLLLSLPPFIESPFVDADPEGNVCFEWDKNENTFSVCVKDSEEFFYAGLIGDSEVRNKGHVDDNAEIAVNITRVFS